MCECLTGMFAYTLCAFPQSPEEFSGSPGTVVMDGCIFAAWELNLGPLQKQTVYNPWAISSTPLKQVFI